MKKKIGSYYGTLRKLTLGMSATDKAGKVLGLQAGLEKAVRLILACGKSDGKLMFIGNGASASIASHMAADFWKNAGVKAVAFNDAALLTCVSNDFGYPQVFEKPIEMFADAGDVLVAISSSGKSENVLKGADMALLKKCRIITLSGFKKDNPLHAMGDVNFHVPFLSYGHVEVLHHSLCHCMLDATVAATEKGRSK